MGGALREELEAAAARGGTGTRPWVGGGRPDASVELAPPLPALLPPLPPGQPRRSWEPRRTYATRESAGTAESHLGGRHQAVAGHTALPGPGGAHRRLRLWSSPLKCWPQRTCTSLTATAAFARSRIHTSSFQLLKEAQRVATRTVNTHKAQHTFCVREGRSELFHSPLKPWRLLNCPTMSR